MMFVFCALWVVSASVPIIFPTRNGWAVATPAEVGLDEQRLANSFDELEAQYPGGVGEVYVTRWGREAWSYGIPSSGYDAKEIWSISKTVVAMNAAVHVHSWDDPVPFSDSPRAAGATYNTTYFDGGVEDPGNFKTWRQLFTMTSGFGLVNTTSGSPGCAYNNNGIELAGLTLLAMLNATDPTVLLMNLFDIVGSQDVIGYNSAGQMSGYRGGYTMSVRDLTRLGLLILANGTWEGVEVLPGWFIERGTQPQVPAATPVNYDKNNSKLWNETPLSEALPYDPKGHPGRMGGDLGYGFTTWLLPNAGPRGVHFSGLYGNYVCISPATGLVIGVLNNATAHPTASDYYDAVKKAIVR